MADLESKILGDNIKDNYCSSSEDEGDQCESGGGGQRGPAAASSGGPPRPSCNTGPKGVVADYRRYKQLQCEKDEAKGKELTALAHKLSMTCRSYNDDVLDAEREKQESAQSAAGDGVDDEGDEFLRDYLQKRMEEMRKMAQLAQKAPKYGAVVELSSGDDYLSVTDNQPENTLVLIFIYEPTIKGCKQMHRCFDTLAEQFPSVKCCKVRASALHTSSKFRSGGVPALQAYKNSDLVGNFVRLTDELGPEIYPDDVIGFLQDYGILPDCDAQCGTVSAASGNGGRDSDSDFGVD